MPLKHALNLITDMKVTLEGEASSDSGILWRLQGVANLNVIAKLGPQKHRSSAKIEPRHNETNLTKAF